MKERPILFSGEMVRAILDGRKTQTRRVMRDPPHAVEPFDTPNVTIYLYNGKPMERWYRFDKQTDGLIETRRHGVTYPRTKAAARRAANWLHSYHRNDGVRWSIDEVMEALSPYGVPGDRLWVREAWQAWKEYDHLPPRDIPRHSVNYLALTDNRWDSRYRHARFMPRWASRITLEITDVRVQRVQEISHEDARAEGVYAAPHRGPQNTREEAAQYGGCLWNTGIEQCFGCSFMLLWNQINGPRGFGWDKKPWVWVLTFTRVQ